MNMLLSQQSLRGEKATTKKTLVPVVLSLICFSTSDTCSLFISKLRNITIVTETEARYIGGQALRKNQMFSIESMQMIG